MRCVYKSFQEIAIVYFVNYTEASKEWLLFLWCLCIMPDFPVLYCLLEFAQAHVHWVDDAIQPSHPLSPSSPPALNLSQHQGLFQWISSSHQVPKAMELLLQLPMNIQDWFPLGWTSWISMLSKVLSRIFSNTRVQKHQFFGTQLSSQSNSRICIWPQEKP